MFNQYLPAMYSQYLLYVKPLTSTQHCTSVLEYWINNRTALLPSKIAYSDNIPWRQTYTRTRAIYTLLWKTFIIGIDTCLSCRCRAIKTAFNPFIQTNTINTISLIFLITTNPLEKIIYSCLDTLYSRVGFHVINRAATCVHVSPRPA